MFVNDVIENSLRERTVVFDLDDTLYAEADYVTSGKAAVADMVYRLFGVNCTNDISLMETGFLEYITERLRGDGNLKESLLWVYRNHQPNIQLRPGAGELIAALEQREDHVAIITDGRSLTQRLKVAALKLEIDPIYISAEIGVEKPDPFAFLAVEQRCPASSFVYVGDNVLKDFVVPRIRGWLSVGIRQDERAIHKVTGATKNRCEPDVWVDSFEALQLLLMD